MALEALADPLVRGAYPFPLVAAGATASPGVLDWGPLLHALVEDGARGVAPAVRSARFHNALVEGIAAVAPGTGCDRVALSGGCFQNRLLLERTRDEARGGGVHGPRPPARPAERRGDRPRAGGGRRRGSGAGFPRRTSGAAPVPM